MKKFDIWANGNGYSSYESPDDIEVSVTEKGDIDIRYTESEFRFERNVIFDPILWEKVKNKVDAILPEASANKTKYLAKIYEIHKKNINTQFNKGTELMEEILKNEQFRGGIK